MTLKELRERARDAGIVGASKMNTAQVTEALKGQGPVVIEATSGGGQVTVARHEDEVIVTWLCGARRTFTVEDLRVTLERFEQVSTHGIWYEDDDSRHNGWAAVLRDGQFHGDDHVDGRSGTVSWDEFQRALHDSLT